AAQLGMSATPQGWPSQSSAPLSQSGYGPQGWPSESSAPLSQSQQAGQGWPSPSSTPLAAGDRWGQAHGPQGQAPGFGQGMPGLPATSPWAFPAQEPDPMDYQG